MHIIFLLFCLVCENRVAKSCVIIYTHFYLFKYGVGLSHTGCVRDSMYECVCVRCVCICVYGFLVLQDFSAVLVLLRRKRLDKISCMFVRERAQQLRQQRRRRKSKQIKPKRGATKKSHTHTHTLSCFSRKQKNPVHISTRNHGGVCVCVYVRARFCQKKNKIGEKVFFIIHAVLLVQILLSFSNDCWVAVCCTLSGCSLCRVR